MYNCIKKQVQVHVDFVNDFLTTHQDFRTDVTGLGKLTDEQLAEVLALEEEIQKAGIPAQAPQVPGWMDYPMTSVASSFIRGAGAYKGKLLLEFHHDKGNIWGFDVNGQGAEFFRELLNAGSKGGWVWDKILGKPSQYGMAKGKFFAYPDQNGQMKFYTTPGAQFVHKFGRPAKFTYNPVGYLSNETQYNIGAEKGKAWKESLVIPFWSREPIEPSLLKELQRKEAFVGLQEEFGRIKTYEELRVLLEKEQRFNTLQELQEMLKEKQLKKDFSIDTLKHILDTQMTLTPTINPMINPIVSKIDLTEDRWITKRGRHIWIKNWYTPEELNKYDPKTGAGLVEIEPWLRIDRSVDIRKGISMGLLNRTLEKFPLKLKNFINEFRVFNKITDHPSMSKSKGKVPKSYEAVGWTKTYDDINGVYIPSENNAYISIDATPHTIRHELGHAVWYGMSEREREDFRDIWRQRRWDLLDMADEALRKSREKTGYAKESYEIRGRGWGYEANDVGEFFAESFERYYEAKRPVWEWQVPTRQKQPFPEVATFFRRRMKKYEKD